ncbi:hypothetical protein B0H10DRAFT_1953429 [Mycena sp. CBHHK59/15]|nr:hypothetical protein B0H10DRAFT_1972653 [Mycena sp. CBHHK59/15]KAJ6610936.1 hypothetical protein B0H10DRAFT_1953429 [Mycena sp. CBHHK59/15]
MRTRRTVYTIVFGHEYAYDDSGDFQKFRDLQKEIRVWYRKCNTRKHAAEEGEVKNARPKTCQINKWAKLSVLRQNSRLVRCLVRRAINKPARMAMVPATTPPAMAAIGSFFLALEEVPEGTYDALESVSTEDICNLSNSASIHVELESGWLF